MPKGIPNKRYTPEFKQLVVETMREERLSVREVMRRFEINDHGSQSIQAKTFLSMLALLVVCCILIYGMVMIFLPRNYHTELEGQVTSDFYDLVAVLERNGWEASSDSLMEFSMRNNASVKVNDNYGNNLFSVNFADMENLDTSAPSMSCSATFQQGE